MNKRSLTMSASTVLLAALALAGCNRNAEQAQAPGKDSTVAQTEQRMEQKVDPAQAGAERGANNAAEVKDGAQDATQATKNAAAEVGDKVGDAMITTTVNAELAKDPKLSALKINVDTADGKVALRGTAPDAASRDRATQLALAVKGVVSVDNQLRIEAAKS
ncbi:BON domain-containing protein [Methylibium sp.]|uniref:BON domain-containing protein n=1 Tax=Methylibium sp. TaxID=2067992 RepID=UPI003D0A5CB5